ncbi:MAG: hypothetical protein AMS26_08290 [Bacteroides sp. SM23_62]|nr:MAG: hypothetical protein AMS26_08290 [Bacteroides sp. SM23_62]
MLSLEKTLKHIIRKTTLAGFILSLVLANPAAGQSKDTASMDQTLKHQRFHISANGIYAILETNIRFESPSGLLGVKINMEENLGLEKYRVMPMFTATFNIKNRHNLFAMYYGLPRDSYYQTRREFEFKGEIVEVGTEIFSYFNTNVYSLGYMYDAVRDSRSQLGLFVNFYILTLGSGVRSTQGLINESFQVTAPLPNFGAKAYYKLSKRFGFSGIFSIFFLSVGDFSGSIHHLGGELNYYLTRWLELGLGYYLFDLSIEAEKPQFTGMFDYTYQGPYLSLGFRF